MTALPRAELGTTGISISRFILGGGGIGGVAGVTGPGIGLNEADGGALVEHALQIGINVVDTADIYAAGASERILGRWLAQHPGAELLIETKTGVTPDGPDLSPERLRSKLAAARQTLGRVDLFLPHAVDPDTEWSASLPVLSEAVDQGHIRAYGLSNVTERDLADALQTADWLGVRRPALNQPGVTAPIAGPSKPAHWDAITASVRVAWTDKLSDAVEEAFAG